MQEQQTSVAEAADALAAVYYSGHQLPHGMPKKCLI
jgi:hypothetical protein